MCCSEEDNYDRAMQLKLVLRYSYTSIRSLHIYQGERSAVYSLPLDCEVVHLQINVMQLTPFGTTCTVSPQTTLFMYPSPADLPKNRKIVAS